MLAGLLDHLDVERASFVGNSLGGGAALELALRHPDRVHRLVLLNPAGSPQGLFAPEPGAEMRMLTGYYDPPGASVEKMRAFSYEMVFDPAVASAEFVRGALRGVDRAGAARGATGGDQGAEGPGSGGGLGQPVAALLEGVAADAAHLGSRGPGRAARQGAHVAQAHSRPRG